MSPAPDGPIRPELVDVDEPARPIPFWARDEWVELEPGRMSLRGRTVTGLCRWYHGDQPHWMFRLGGPSGPAEIEGDSPFALVRALRALPA